MTFTIAEAPREDPVQVTTSQFDLTELTLSTSSSSKGDAVTITVTPMARGTHTLVSAWNGYTMGGSLNAVPFWKKDSLFCQEAVPTSDSRPIAEVVAREAIAPLGVLVAQNLSELTEYPTVPYCGLTWRGYRIAEENVEMQDGDSLPLNGTEMSFDVVTTSQRAEQVSREALKPAGWAFSWGRVPVGASESCPVIGSSQWGPGFSTIPLC